MKVDFFTSINIICSRHKIILIFSKKKEYFKLKLIFLQLILT